MQQAARKSSPVAGVVAAAGGALLIIGSLLGWLKITATSSLIPAPISETVKGVDGNGGKLALAAGIVLLVVGLVLAMTSQARASLGVAALILGVIGAGVGIYNIATKTSQVNAEIRKGMEAATHGQVTDAQMQQIMRLLHLKTTAGAGIYLTVLGGVVGLAGGAMAMAGGSAAGPGLVEPGTAGFGAAPMPSPTGGSGAAPEAPPMPPFPSPTPSTPEAPMVEPGTTPSSGGESEHPDAPAT